MNERVKNSARNMVAATIFRVINLAFPFVVNTIIIQVLGVEYLGLNMLFASILQVLSITELGFGTALIFSMYEPVANHDTAKVSALLNLYRKVYLVIGGIILAGGMACIPVLPYIIEGDVPPDLNLYVLFIISLSNSAIPYFLFSYRSSLFTANQRSDIIDKINIIVEISLNVSKIVILLITGNYYLFCILQVVFSAFRGLLLWLISKRMFPEYKAEGNISKEEKKSLFSRVVGLSINKLCNVLSNSFDSIIISSFLGLTILGQYNNYFVITNAIILFLCIITYSSTPSIGNSLVCESIEKNYEDFCLFQFGFSLVTGWASICLLCLVQPFVRLWLGEELMFDDATAAVFSVYVYSILSSAVFMTYREAAGIWAHDKVRPFVEGGLNLLMNIVLVQFIGVKGVMISTIITMGIIRTVWGSKFLFREFFVSFSHARYLLKMLSYMVVSIIAGIVTLFICQYIEIQNILGLLIKGIICIIVPGVIYVLVYFRSNEFRKGVAFAKSVLRRRHKQN